MVIRMLVVSAVFVTASVWMAHSRGPERVPLRQPLATLPGQFDRWNGHDEPPLDEKIAAALGADEYLNRVYIRPRETPVGLFVGFYESQRAGDSMHSPLNCLPGSGWEPVAHDHISLNVTDAEGAARNVIVNRFIVQKGLDRDLVLYWYQSHGRIVASEYASKFYMVYDAIRLNRSDAALVRVITPIVDGDAADGSQAAQHAVHFVQSVFPSLSRLIPS